MVDDREGEGRRHAPLLCMRKAGGDLRRVGARIALLRSHLSLEGRAAAWGHRRKEGGGSSSSSCDCWQSLAAKISRYLETAELLYTVVCFFVCFNLP